MPFSPPSPDTLVEEPKGFTPPSPDSFIPEPETVSHATSHDEEADLVRPDEGFESSELGLTPMTDAAIARQAKGIGLAAEMRALRATKPAPIFGGTPAGLAAEAVSSVGQSAAAVVKGAAAASEPAIEGILQAHGRPPTSATARREFIKKSPQYQAGATSEKYFTDLYEKYVPEEERETLAHQLVGTTAGLVPAVTGPLAPFIFGLSSAGEHFDHDYEAAIAEGESPANAAEKAATNAYTSGAKEVALWEFGPRVFRKFLGDKITGKVGFDRAKMWLRSTGSSSAELATLSAASRASENVISGKPVGEGVGTAATSGALLGAAMKGVTVPETPATQAAKMLDATAGKRFDPFAEDFAILGGEPLGGDPMAEHFERLKSVAPLTAEALAKQSKPSPETSEYNGYKYTKIRGQWVAENGQVIPMGDSSASASKADRDAARFWNEIESRKGGAKPFEPPPPTSIVEEQPKGETDASTQQTPVEVPGGETPGTTPPVATGSAGEVQQPTTPRPETETGAPKAPEEVATPPLPPNHQPVTIQRADGTTYEAHFGGYYTEHPGQPPVITRLKEGSWSTGSLYPGEKIVSEVPAPPPPGQPYSKESLKSAFNLTDEQADAVHAIAQSMGLDPSKIMVAKGGLPSPEALLQDDVIKGRDPEIQNGIRDLLAGKITQDEYNSIVQRKKPIAPTAVPVPVPAAEIAADVKAPSKQFVGKGETIPPGTVVGLRTDLPFKNKTGKAAVVVHSEGSGTKPGKVLAFEGTGRILNPKFVASEKAAAKIGTGEARTPFAFVQGEWSADQRIPEDVGSWAQVGYDPTRHSYYYDKSSLLPVIGGSEAIQIGNTVFVKDPVYGDLKKVLYQEAEGRAKGATEFTQDGKAIIRGFTSADVSTALHELAHVARRQLVERGRKLTDEEVGAIETWAGATDGTWTRPAEEKFARGFERYMRDGTAPSQIIKAAFDKIKAWLTEIYQNLAGSPIAEKVPEHIEKIFGKMVSPEGPRRTWEQERAEMQRRQEEAKKKVSDVPEGATTIELKDEKGFKIVVSPSTQEPGKWQLTWFTKDGEPHGHSNFDTRNDALSSAVGIHGNWGPPHGNSTYKVTRTLGEAKPKVADYLRALEIKNAFGLSPEDAHFFDVALNEVAKDPSKWTTLAEGVQKEAMRAAVAAQGSLAKTGDLSLAKKIAEKYLGEAPKPKAKAKKPAEPKPAAAHDREKIEAMLTAEQPADLETARANVKTVGDIAKGYRKEADAIQEQINALKRVIMLQTGRFKGQRIKQSAKKVDVDKYRALEKQHREKFIQITALEESIRKDKEKIDAAVDAEIISDKNQPYLRRLDRKIRSMEGKAPPELIAAREAEIERLILEKFPDATPEEIKEMGGNMQRAAYFDTGKDLFGEFQRVGGISPPEMRRRKIAAAINAEGVPKHLFPEELTARINRFDKGGRVYGKTDVNAPVENPSAVETADILSQIKSHTERIHAEEKAKAEKLAAEKAAEEAKEAQLIEEAQQIADSAPKATGKTAKGVRDELVRRIKVAIDDLIRKSGTTIKQGVEDPTQWAAKNSDDTVAAWGTIEPAGKGFKVEATRAGGKTASYRVATMEEAQWVIKALASEAIGKAVIGVPGDGVFRLEKRGESLIKVWDDAKGIDVSSKKQPYKPGGPAEPPPKEIKTAAQWDEAKEYHGLGPEDKIHDWSPALKAFAEKLGPMIHEDTKDVTTAMVDEWIKKKAEEKSKPKPKPEEGAKESRIGGTGTGKRDIFSMDDGDLSDFFNERFGETGTSGSPGAFGRPGPYTFPDYNSFKKWMDARYTERDLEGMKLGFAEADAPFKVRYVKDNLSSAEHLKAWIRHMASGAPLPAEDPPIPRTTPRPNARGTPVPGTTAPPPQPPTPQGPPPPPRTPTPYRKFDITALTQLFRQFHRFPTVNERLKRAYGRFLEDSGAVELKQRLMWDTKLAERVLGHEIGHFIDLMLPIIGKGQGLANRIMPLFGSFKGQMWRSKQLRDDAVDLSRQWRGDFNRGDTYRDTAEELFADFMSAMFNNPKWVNEKYPRLHDAFQDLRDGKPAFKSAYREIETWLQGGTMVDELRTQHRSAIQRTIDILTKEDKKVRSSFMDRLTFDAVSLWQRAFEKEGKPRAIGSRITEKLETSYLWASKKLALWHDDFMQKVQPFLDQVSKDDPLQAHTDLQSYSLAVRTIGERRAAGVWIDQHPQEAFDMLQHILNIDPLLKSKFQLQLDAIGQHGDLYDLSAAVFREIHDRGEKYVSHIARQIDRLNLGVRGEAALIAFNVRGKLLNPGGLTEENSLAMLRRLRDDLGPQRFAALESAAQNLRDIMHDVQSEMHDEGLISEKTWKELIEPNANNYLPYAVLDYFDGKVRAGVLPQKGTARDVADVSAAAQLKAASSYVWLQKQRQVKLIRQAYAKGGQILPIGEALKKAEDVEDFRAQNPNDDISRAVIWVDGTPHLMEFPNDKGKLLQEALTMPEFYGHVEWLNIASNLSHKVMQLFTQLSPRFLFYRNVIRGARTAALKVGPISVGKQLFTSRAKESYRLAKNYAEAAFGGTMLPEVRALVESEALPPPRVAAGAVRDLPQMRQMLLQGALPVFQATRLRRQVSADKTGKAAEAARQAKMVTDKIFTGYEAFEKIYNYNAAIEKGYTEQQAAAIAARGGIPRPGVSGKWSSVMEIFFPWTRVRTQGIRASYDMARDPELKKGFAGRFALFEAAPRLAKVAIATGVASKAISWMMSKDEDPDDTVMGEVFRRVSPYKMALDDVLPMYFYDARTGETHAFWKYKKGSDVPKHFEVVSLRLPSSEEGQTWGTMLYNAMASIPGAREKISAPGQEGLENMGNWAENYLKPQWSPVITTTSDLQAMILQNRNPPDPFRYQPSANPMLFNAGGADKAQAIAGYTLNRLGGPGELAAVIAGNFGLLDERAMDALSRRMASDKQSWDQKIPFLGAAISHDNYAEYREEKNEKFVEERIRNKAKLIMSPEVRGLYDFYYSNIDRKDKLSDDELEMLDISKYFVTKIWGSLKNPDSFFAKAAHAVGPDGSKEAKETFKRDLDAASADAIALMREARSPKK